MLKKLIEAVSVVESSNEYFKDKDDALKVVQMYVLDFDDKEFNAFVKVMQKCAKDFFGMNIDIDNAMEQGKDFFEKLKDAAADKTIKFFDALSIKIKSFDFKDIDMDV